MRRLSKIVFVNSANIRYGEVCLDGNVHLIGTQGVGKSTVLRAILFFYTGDKTRLGISREKKSFDDFYLPGANSYIAYQVESEYGAFTVLVFRRNAHSVFRFIGAPFSRDWLIDERGEVTADSSVIRCRLGSASMSRMVEEYQEYRDIIYGNRRVTGKEFARFCIMETSKYQNIPRSLQNVFLGAKVDADFIKDIIIRSLGDEEPGIDLVYFRSQLAGFEREYNDISAWFTKNAQGEVTIRRQGEKVIELYRKLLYLDEELTIAQLELRYARRIAEESIPLLEKQAEELEVEQKKRSEKLAHLQEKYAGELSSLEQELGVVKEKLDKMLGLKKKYEQLGIQEIINEDGQESAIKTMLESAVRLKERLTREYADISAKYADREHELKLGFSAWKAARDERKVEIGAAYNAQMEKVEHTLRAELEGLDNAFRERENTLRARVEDAYDRMNDADKQLALAAHLAPFASEIEAARSELNRLNGEGKALDASVKEAKVRLDAEVQEGRYREDAVVREYDGRLSEIRGGIDALSARIDELDEMLASMDGSLAQWLTRHKPDWAENIGKVADERTVLCSRNLNPRESEGNTLFGVEIELSALEPKVRTPLQLCEEKRRLEKERSVREVEFETITGEKETELAALRKKINGRIKAMREELAQLQTVTLMMPAKIEDAKGSLAKYEQKTALAREEEKARCVDLLNRCRSERVLGIKALDELKEEQSCEKSKVQEADFKRRKFLARQRDEAIAEVEREIAAREAELQQSLTSLAAERDRELAGQGADTTALARCEAEIKALSVRLEKIAASKEILFSYRRDKEDYFDKRDVFLSRKKTIEGKKASLAEHYSLKRSVEEEALAIAGRNLSDLLARQNSLKEGLKEADNFDQNNALPMLPESREQKSDKTCRQLIDAIHGLLSTKRNTEADFYQSVNSFTGHFSPGNIFEFKTDNRSDEDYRSFAASLAEFIEGDKIEEYRSRTSGHYADLLLRISHEMDEVCRNSSEIDGIIKDINYDFKEKNFIGAVKSIELRTVPSVDKLVVLLSQIKQFADENGFALEGVNLFSGNSRDRVNDTAVGHLGSLMKVLVGEDSGRSRLTLSDTFQLQFRISENDNDTGWVEKISSVGSDGTDVLVKAMVNIMLINVFKERVSGRFSDFCIHCVMDEIGKLHPRNVKGILDFAGARNIFLVNGSPVPYNVTDYRHTYLLTKDGNRTVISELLSRREAAEL